ncbi:MAG: competence/damage-inducible protein A [Clostridiales bacterium]|nr:competence/damage-inducible protein A [Clostridiales bacterium]MDY4060576.1 competence/damage-inducible protein A [Anaerovoracaceae bacterium]
MKAAILCVGTELLFGQTVNTNATYISRQLQLLGFDVLYHHVVGDNPIRLERLIDICFEDCDLIITTGGLGPTEDDLTKEVIAKFVGDELVYDEVSLAGMKKYFSDTHRQMTKNNLKQALFPSKGKIFPNNVGTAPGFLSEKDGKYIIALPGPPREMTTMFEKEIIPYLSERENAVLYYKIIRTYGIGESVLETVLMSLIHGQTDPTIATYAKEGECSLRVTSKRGTIEESKSAVEDMMVKIRNLIGEYIYSEDDEDMAEVLVKELNEKNLQLSSAESCTGGLFAGRITGVAGASKVFGRGYVTYSIESKVEDLGVDNLLIEKYSVVSGEVASEMAVKALEKSGSDVAVSVTGVAGPSDEGDIPAGKIYLGISWKDDRGNVKTKVQLMNSGRHDRRKNREYAVLAMMHMVLKLVRSL